ncbi:hypothetical protein J6590_105207 [Homalodisca vitripennis]|nr:hypothetical protein J6590_105207 [Homalodisca vitripennis]
MRKDQTSSGNLFSVTKSSTAVLNDTHSKEEVTGLDQAGSRLFRDNEQTSLALTKQEADSPGTMRKDQTSSGNLFSVSTSSTAVLNDTHSKEEVTGLDQAGSRLFKDNAKDETSSVPACQQLLLRFCIIRTARQMSLALTTKQEAESPRTMSRDQTSSGPACQHLLLRFCTIRTARQTSAALTKQEADSPGTMSKNQTSSGPACQHLLLRFCTIRIARQTSLALIKQEADSSGTMRKEQTSSGPACQHLLLRFCTIRTARQTSLALTKQEADSSGIMS